MRVIIFFDLPTETAVDRRNYRKFRTFLIRSGFIMMQESVYSKLAANTSVVKTIEGNVRKNKPPKGLIQMLTVTEKQFAKMEFVLGEKNDSVLDSAERLVIY